MPALATPPSPPAICIKFTSPYSRKAAGGVEGKYIDDAQDKVLQRWLKNAASLRSDANEAIVASDVTDDGLPGELPPVKDVPIVRFVQTTFYKAGPYEGVPLHESEEQLAEELPLEELPPVKEAPIVRFVQTKFYKLGSSNSLPVSDSEE